MSALTERAETVAAIIVAKRDPLGSEPRDDIWCRAALAEAYALGFLAGLEQAETVVRIERECCAADFDAENASL